mgnify:CR=1 FL=1
MLDKYADLYCRLGTLCQSGTTLAQSLSILAETESSKISKGLFRAIDTIDRGGSLQEALENAQIFEIYEIKMMVGADRSGHLPEILARLAEQRERKAKRIQELYMRLAYPVLLLHLAILGPSLFIFVQHGAQAYWKTVLPVLGGIYFFAFLPFAIIKLSREFPLLAFTLDYSLLKIPFLGKSLLKYQLAHSITIFQGLYHSGISIVETIEHVIDVTKNSVVRSCFQRIHSRLLQRQSLSEAIKYERILPNYVRNMMSTGETSGRLEESLLKARDLLDHEAETSTKMLISTSVTLFFLGAAVFVAYKIIIFYSGYFNQIKGIMGN